MYKKALFFALMAPLSMVAGEPEKDPIVGYMFANPNALENIRFNKPPKSSTLKISFSDPNELLKELAPYEPVFKPGDVLAIREFTIDDEFIEIFNFKDRRRKQRALSKAHDAINDAMHRELEYKIRMENPSVECGPLVRRTPDYAFTQDFEKDIDCFEDIAPTVVVKPDIAQLISQEKLTKLIGIEKQMSENNTTMNAFMKTETYKQARSRGTKNDFEDPRAITRKDVQSW